MEDAAFRYFVFACAVVCFLGVPLIYYAGRIANDIQAIRSKLLEEK
jgi:hypothetical protein